MPLKRLFIHHARNINDLSLDFHPNYNIIYGPNGAGKTTILESIYLLLRARTFRTNKFKSFININSEECVIYSNFFKSNDILDFTLGIKRSKADKSPPIVHFNKIKITSLAQISQVVILGLITPDSFNLLDSGPDIRRKYLDWGVFHVEHLFLNVWKDYKRVLMNRNSLLKKYSSNYSGNIKSIQSEILVWDKQLVSLNSKIDQYRSNQFNKILPVFFKILNCFSKPLAKDITLSFYQGWNKDIYYSELLSIKLEDDIKKGYTSYGSHRSDIKFLFNGKQAKELLSRGQKKILVISLVLAQFIYIMDNKKESLPESYHHFILLLDDIDSELDKNNIKKFFNYLAHFKNIQYFISTTNPTSFNFIEDNKKEMFHVEQ